MSEPYRHSAPKPLELVDVPPRSRKPLHFAWRMSALTIAYIGFLYAAAWAGDQGYFSPVTAVHLLHVIIIMTAGIIGLVVVVGGWITRGQFK